MFLPCIYPNFAQAYPAPCHKRFFCKHNKPEFQGCFPICFVPFHLEHYTERVGCLIIIFLGEMVDDITISGEEHTWEFYICCACSLLIIAISKLLYFDHTCDDIDMHAMRIDRLRGIFWGKNYYLLVLCIALMGSGLSMACHFANALRKEEEEINMHAARWLICGGLTGILASLTFNNNLHRKEWELPREQQRVDIVDTLQRISTIQAISHGVAAAALLIVAVYVDESTLSTTKLLIWISCGMIVLLLLTFWDRVVESDYEVKQHNEDLQQLQVHVADEPVQETDTLEKPLLQSHTSGVRTGSAKTTADAPSKTHLSLMKEMETLLKDCSDTEALSDAVAILKRAEAIVQHPTVPLLSWSNSRRRASVVMHVGGHNHHQNHHGRRSSLVSETSGVQNE